MSKKMAKQNSQTSTTNKEPDFQKPLTAIQNNFNITTNIDINYTPVSESPFLSVKTTKI